METTLSMSWKMILSGTFHSGVAMMIGKRRLGNGSFADKIVFGSKENIDDFVIILQNTYNVA